jgi:hypothetical protein
MANVKDRIERIRDYFVAMKVEELEDGNQVIFVTVKFPTRWFILDNIEEKYGVVVERSKDEKGVYFVGASLEDGFEPIFDAIDENINVMELAEERTKLLDEKIKELKKVFDDADNTVEMLRNLEFSFRKTSAKQGRQAKGKTKAENNETEENNKED